jgi:dihydrolipoamide dehydrogenase
VKIVTDRRLGEILGIHLVGPEVTELLPEGVLGKSLEATALEIGQAVHAHPTLSEAVKEAALAALGRAVHG